MNLYCFTPFIDKRGWLLPLEFNKLPFVPKRVFFVSNVPLGMRRGEHAHYKTQQYLICLSGKVRVGLHDGKNLEERDICQGESVFIDRKIWDYQDFLTKDACIAVLCSTEYDHKDYITSFKKFLFVKSSGIARQ